MWCVDPGWRPGAYQSHSITPPSSAGQGTGNITKGSWVEIRTGRDRSPTTVTRSSAGLPTGSQPPLDIHLLWQEVPSTGCRWIFAPPWTTMGCRGIACLTMVFITGCGGISALVPGAPPPPPSLTLVSAELFLSHHLTPLSRLLFSQQFFSSVLTLLSQRRYHRR